MGTKFQGTQGLALSALEPLAESNSSVYILLTFCTDLVNPYGRIEEPRLKRQDEQPQHLLQQSTSVIYDVLENLNEP